MVLEEDRHAAVDPDVQDGHQLALDPVAQAWALALVDLSGEHDGRLLVHVSPPGSRGGLSWFASRRVARAVRAYAADRVLGNVLSGSLPGRVAGELTLAVRIVA